MSNKSLKYQYHKNWKVNFETFDNYSQDFYILAHQSVKLIFPFLMPMQSSFSMTVGNFAYHTKKISKTKNDAFNF